MDAKLTGYPFCREFRRKSPLALKLLDIPMLGREAQVACCDTDIMAFGPFAVVFDAVDQKTSGTFMRDPQNAYALRPWHLVAPGIALPMFNNTGLMLFRRSHQDLDFLKWFLGRPLSLFVPPKGHS